MRRFWTVLLVALCFAAGDASAAPGPGPSVEPCLTVAEVLAVHPDLPPEGRAAITSQLISEAKRRSSKVVAVTDPRMVPALRSALPTDVLVLLQRSKSIAEASVQLEAAPVRTIVLHNVPTSQATAMRIHGSAAVMLPDSYFASLREASGQVFRALPPDQVVDLTSIQASNDSSIAAWVARRVQGQHRDELTVLIGHIDGGAVAFPDGSHLPLGVVDELGGSGSHGQIWIIGCNTLLDLTPKDAVSFGTGRRITYTEALHTAGIVASEANRGSSYRDILLKVQNDRTSTYAIGLVGTGIVLMQRPECREEKPCK